MPRKLRRKGDGSLELDDQRCRRCGTRNMGISITKLVYHCWKCGLSGSLQPSNLPGLPPEDTTCATRKEAPLSSLPDYARTLIEKRGQDPLWLERRYGVRWDGERLHWPCGAGSSKRAIWPWDEPKTLTIPPRGLIGQHLLVKGARVVVTEGDYKSSVIPLPWIGLGHLGGCLSEEQAATILSFEPEEIVLMEDGGCRDKVEAAKKVLAPSPVRVVELPSGLGPDDIPRGALYALLGGWK